VSEIGGEIRVLEVARFGSRKPGFCVRIGTRVLAVGWCVFRCCAGFWGDGEEWVSVEWPTPRRGRGCTSSARMGHVGFQVKRQSKPMLIGLV